MLQLLQKERKWHLEEWFNELEKDLQKLKKEKQMKESAIAQLRKRSKDSNARPRAEKNILTKNPELQRI